MGKEIREHEKRKSRERKKIMYYNVLLIKFVCVCMGRARNEKENSIIFLLPLW